VSLSEFERSRDWIIREIDRGSEAAIKRALVLLNEVRREVLAQIRAAGDLTSDLFRMRLVQQSIERSIAQFETQLSFVMRTETQAQFDRGVALVDKPLGALDISSITGLSRESVFVAEQFNADLITGLTSEIRNKINAILRRAVLGGLTFQQAQNEIGRSLTSRGAFSSIAGRAEAILRTELLRVQSQATQMRMEQQNKQMAAAGYELLKAWLATNDTRTRATHRIAGTKYGEENAIGVDEEFTVGGEKCLYPRDPSLSAKESVNCRCVSQPIVRRIALEEAA
jgi:hypothetical protein